MKWSMFKVYTASRSLHPKKGTNTQKKNRVKNTGYKINLDFDVIYTKHMLIIYLKIIYFFLQNRILYMIHWRLNSAEFWIWEYGRPWRLKTDWLLHHAPLSRENFLGLCTIYKQTKNALGVHLVFLSCLFWIRSIIENLSVIGPRSVTHTHRHARTRTRTHTRTHTNKHTLAHFCFWSSGQDCLSVSLIHAVIWGFLCTSAWDKTPYRTESIQFMFCDRLRISKRRGLRSQRTGEGFNWAGVDNTSTLERYSATTTLFHLDYSLCEVCVRLYMCSV